MTTISPRPWRTIHADKHYVVGVFDSNGDIVANVYGYLWHPEKRVSTEHSDRALANARLFVAAEELVAALSEMLETQVKPDAVAYAEKMFHRNEGEWENPGDEEMVLQWHDRCRDAQANARNLLARIRGEASE